MRRRVLEALEQAAGQQPAERTRRGLGAWLAQCASATPSAVGASQKTRTDSAFARFDSLCDSITRRMPWLSRLGSQPELLEDASELYREAARNTIALVDDETYGPYLERVLLHLDNDFAALEELLAAMLGRRDQWLRHLAGVKAAEARPILEDSLRGVVEEAIDVGARSAAPDFLAEDLPDLDAARRRQRWMTATRSRSARSWTACREAR